MPDKRPARGSRAAQAAARVAARYANAPSYNEILTREARAAVQAAEAASKAAQEAHAAFQYVLDGLEAVKSAEPAWEPRPASERHGGPVVVPPPQKPAERPHIHAETAIAPAWELETESQQDEAVSYEAPPRYDLADGAQAHAAEPGESVQPIYANLIEFPREMVATRRARPRRAEGPLATAESAPQLSIFEVDPAAISIEPAPVSMDAAAEPSWMHPDWSEMTLQALPPTIEAEAPSSTMDAAALPPAIDLAALPPSMSLGVETQEEKFGGRFPKDPPPPPWPAPALQIELAPMSRRLLAMVVDCTLIAGALLGAAILAASNVGALPGVRTVEFGAAVALLALGIAYQAFFMTMARATPGMKYAGLEINTFSGRRATRGQRCARLLALLLSVLPLGLGVVWALFDDDGLTWHDRLSKTYLRKR